MLVFQIVQTRILSVIAWYYLAFFAISVAMLGMTAGAVIVYLGRERFRRDTLNVTLADYSLLCAVSMPLSLMLQFSLITTLALSATTVISWALLLASMAVPYVFAGVVVSLALTRSPFPVSEVYGVDLFGAALGCACVVALLNVLDAPSAIILAGLISGMASIAFQRAANAADRAHLRERPWWRRAVPLTAGLLALTVANVAVPVGIRPILVKDSLERNGLIRFEQWNSYSRVVASRPAMSVPPLWGASSMLDPTLRVSVASLSIDGAAGTFMHRYDGTLASISFLRNDIVNLGYNLPGIAKSAVIGVGGGRDVLSAHLFGVRDITGVELNPIFVNLLTKHPFYKDFANLTALPNLRLYVDDARSWFARSPERFDLIQMSMIDTWAATGAGAFSLSENGLYTLEGWRVFVGHLSANGSFTVSRWYNPQDLDETGRMIALASAAMIDAGATDPASHIFVANTDHIATLVLSKRPFTTDQLRTLHAEVDRLAFNVLIAPDQPSGSALLNGLVASHDLAGVNRVAGSSFLDMTVPTDNRPFFFNQLRISKIPEAVRRMRDGRLGAGVVSGNLVATAVLVLIFVISVVAVIATIVLPLKRSAATTGPKHFVAAGTAYFSLIGMGYMLAEISLLQFFSVYLGHPIYSLGVCLFSLILATGIGSLASGRLSITSPRRLQIWGALVAGYLITLQYVVTPLFYATAGETRGLRILISLAIVMPLGFLLGFAFPNGMRLIERVDATPAPWFWGINGATGVLASVIGVIVSMSFGINVTMLVAAACYFAVIPVAMRLAGLGRHDTTSRKAA